MTDSFTAQKPSKIADDLTLYWSTYNDQINVDLYSPGIIIDDALYGLGIAINPELFKEADGYEKFKKVIKEHLDR